MNVSCTTHFGTPASIIVDLRQKLQQNPGDELTALALAIALFVDIQYSEAIQVGSTVYSSTEEKSRAGGERSRSEAKSEIRRALCRAKGMIESEFPSDPDSPSDLTIVLQQFEVMLETFNCEDGS